MEKWREAMVSPHMSVRGVMETLERSGLQIALVVDESGILRGVVTDGDIRRALLQDRGVEEPITCLMNAEPKVIHPNLRRSRILAIMRENEIQHLPVVDEGGRLTGLETMSQMVLPEGRPNPVVIMAGGLGTRLRPLTNDCPKPLVEVGGVPILQTLLERLIAQGFSQFYFSVNYKSEMIHDHFGDGHDWNVQIDYLREKKRRGTAGPLSLLPEAPQDPIVVLNGDLLTTLDFGRMVDYHMDQSVIATMGVRHHNMTVPYGVIEINGRKIAKIEEKPTQTFFVNAGIYVLEPAILKRIPGNTYFDMTELFEDLISVDSDVTAYPIQEYWRDVGQQHDLELAEEEYELMFG